MKRWLWVLVLWACASDPKTEADPEPDQGDAADLDAAPDQAVEAALATLELASTGPCGLTLPTTPEAELAGDDLTALTVAVGGTDPESPDGRFADGTPVRLRQLPEEASVAQVVVFLGVLEAALDDAQPLEVAIEAARVGQGIMAGGEARERVVCLAEGRVTVLAEIVDHRGRGLLAVADDRRLILTCAAPGDFARACAATPDAGVDAAVDATVDAGVDASLDAGIDLDASPDAAPDATPPEVDAALDLAVLPDQGPDAAPDQGVVVIEPLRCAPVRPLGGECYGDDRACEPGLTCIAGRCAPRSAEGGDCETANDCEGALYCRAFSLNGEPLAIGVCTPRGQVGEACHRRNFGCEFGLTCLFDRCAELGGLDGPCLTTGDCDRTTWCDRPGGIEVGLCQPFEPEGAACDPQNNGCGPNLACLEGICGFRQVVGGGCGQAADCQPAQYCDRIDDEGNVRVDPLCQDRRERGEPCDGREGSMCRQSRCIQGICAVDQPIGGACDSTFDCAAGGFCPQPR